MSPPLRVGVIGAGAMGAAHVRILSTSTAARVSAVFDADLRRATAVAADVHAVVAGTAQELIHDVDAVVIASPDPTHAELALACLAARRPTLCEKPLATTLLDAKQVLDAELASGQRLLQLGFMRRYDPAFRALKSTVDSGDLGPTRVVHCIHRNAVAHPDATAEGIIGNSMIHELDVLRWLLTDEIATIDIRAPETGLRDPQLAMLRMHSGVLVSVEVFLNAGYAYDVRCEVVGDRAAASLPAHPEADFLARFDAAYRLELEDWVSGALAGTVSGPTVWDGYVAGISAAAGIRALHSGTTEEIRQPPRPAMYS